MRPIAIYGAGGLGREVLALIKSLDHYHPVGFYDDALSKGTMVAGCPVLGDFEDLKRHNQDLSMVVAVGNPSIKRVIADRIKDLNFLNFPPIVHHTAILLDPSNISLGQGVIVGAGVIMTTDIVVGDHVLVNLKTTVGHDCKIGSNTSIMPGANLAGGVNVGQEVLIGTGASIRNGIRIGHKSIIGMGCVVVRDVEDGRTLVGVPGRNLDTKTE